MRKLLFLSFLCWNTVLCLGQRHDGIMAKVEFAEFRRPSTIATQIPVVKVYYNSNTSMFTNDPSGIVINGEGLYQVEGFISFLSVDQRATRVYRPYVSVKSVVRGPSDEIEFYCNGEGQADPYNQPSSISVSTPITYSKTYTFQYLVRVVKTSTVKVTGSVARPDYPSTGDVERNHFKGTLSIHRIGD